MDKRISDSDSAPENMLETAHVVVVTCICLFFLGFFPSFINLQTWSVNYKIAKILRTVEIHKKFPYNKMLRIL